ncbi:MAG TPA: elongation factor 4 [Fusobacteria bacterium]|nr:elongation factor 4 [Fusobacteriota bacterium]|tara:strand:+ start:2420 stop:4207 length:1788 start_codon:yes stop_codon:yes gene_type:complete
MKKIRNFSIIAHIDHGKSTLADRILEKTGTVSDREMKSQMLDSMDLEREKGITIKSQAVTLRYKSKSGEDYIFNLIDTPGHVDFSYEVSRSLQACEGALLVVDSTQGVEAQTLANVYLALENNLELLTVINKVDLPNADPDRVKLDIESSIGIDTFNAISVSAKTGIGVDELLEAIVTTIPAPQNRDKEKTRALVFDSSFDEFRGVITFIRVFDGVLKKRDKVLFMATGKKLEILDIGVLTPKMECRDSLSSGEVGYVITGAKEVGDARIGDTITLFNDPADEALPGYREVKPMVFAGIYPVNNDDFTNLKESLEKVRLNDPSLSYEPDSSAALGFGFRVGFLGLLHMEIIVERLKREYNLSLITSSPSVIYRVFSINGKEMEISNPSEMPPSQEISKILEPIALGTIFVPEHFVGDVMQLCNKKRGKFKNMSHSDNRVMISYELPMNEIILDFYDKLKSRTKGYASFDYEFLKYEEADLVKVDILLNSEIVDALSIITHRDSSYYKGRELTEKLREVIPKHMFDIPIQASIGNKIIARETIKAMRKNVLSKCYGGDITRKRKLLEKQKEGKRKMKSIGSVSIPQEAFLTVLKLD